MSARDPRETSLALDETFQSVLNAARSGADWAWSAIYLDTAPMVLGYLRAQRAPDADDLAGEVFVQAVRDLSRFSGERAAFRSWLLAIAHHRLLDERRRLARRPLDLVSDERLEIQGPQGDDVEQQALRNLGTGQARRLIEGLSDDQRDVLLLRILAGLTIEEVASVVGKRAGAVKALQRRGLAAIGRKISEQGVTL